MSERVNVHVVDTRIDVGLTVMDCANCGVIFAVPKWFDAQRRESGNRFYCPNGHNLSYAESEAERQRKAREKAERDAKFWRDRSERREAERDAAANSLRTTKGHLTRVKRRIEAGVCIHCNRTFQQVARHMARQHPDLVGQEPSDG